MSIFNGPIGQLLGMQPQQAGGVIGQVMQAQQPQGYAPQRQPMQEKPKFWQTPEFASTLSRLGSNLAEASTKNENFLDAFSLATAQTQKDNEAARAQDMQNQLVQAQIQKAQAEAQPAGAFSGTGYQNQILASRYQYHVANGDNDLIARQKAINDFYALNPVTGVDAEGRPIVTQRAALPIGEQSIQQPMGGAMPQPSMPTQGQFIQPQGDAIAQAANALGLPSGMLLPPPSQDGVQGQPITSRGNMIQPPASMGPKTAQATAQAANEAEIGIQGEFGKELANIEAKRLKGMRDSATVINDVAPDMERLTMAIQRYGDTGTLGDMRLTLNKLGSQLGLENPERVAEGELVSKLVSKMAPRMRPEGSGGSSDTDVKMYLDSLPNLYTTPQGAATAYQYFNKLQQYQSSIAREAEDYAYNNRTMRGFDKYIADKKKSGEISLWNADERAVLDAASKGKSAGMAGVAQPITKADYDKLPSGAEFIDPNGVKRRKP